MELPEIVSAEEAVEALIEGLVTPFLPRRSISWDSPSLEQQKTIAKEMYAVVLLYNYYHRKLFPKLEFLDFKSFCKVACISKPSLLKYMNSMYKSDMSSGDTDEPLSITEKMIMDACNVCSSLDASKEVPVMEGWPISKVAVFLVDTSKEHCILKSIGSGRTFKSLVEKHLKLPSENVVCAPKMTNRLDASASLEGVVNGIEDIVQEAAFSVVEEEIGINRSNLSILGSYLSYSLSHLKSCTRLYIMKYAGSIDNQIPIKTVIQRSHGPIVKVNNQPEVTEVIEYCLILPYINIISDWLAGKASPSAAQHNSMQKSDAMKKGSKGILTIDIHEVGDNESSWNCKNMNNNSISKASTFNKKCPSLEDSSVRSQNAANSFFAKKANVEKGEKESTLSALEEQELNFLMAKKRKAEVALVGSSGAAHHYKAVYPYIQYSNTMDKVGELNLENAISHNSVIKTKDRPNQVGGDICNMAVAQNSINQDPLGLSNIFDMKSALQMLKKKRDELCQQQRSLEDKIAHCEMSIQTVISGKDSSPSKIESMLKSCEFLFSNEMKNNANLAIEDAPSQPENISRKKLCEAVLCLQTPCQELDEIFCTNNWILPKYSVLPSTDENSGKFQALVTVRGIDFECESNGDWQSSPAKARDSAATHMLTKLRSMAAQPK